MSQSLHPRAILLDVVPPRLEKDEAVWRLQELDALTKTYGGIVVVSLVQKRAEPNYQTYMGHGKLEEIMRIAFEKRADLLVINNLLKAKQIFEIEGRLRQAKCPMRVWDRIDLILKIFEAHAQTREAKLQIKLAALRHMGPRIFRMGFELMQQAGGIATRGVGETNTEVMRRHLAEQERRVKRELRQMQNARLLQRSRRDRMGWKIISVVGYTNTGKSTLVQALTRKKIKAANELFVSLDTRIGRLSLQDARARILVSDTIGFIQDLPASLVDAFRSTLDETIHADLLLHVIDVSDPRFQRKIEEVEQILEQLGVSERPKLYIFNKIDQKKRFPRRTLEKRYGGMTPVFVSALEGTGLDTLRDCIREKIETL